MIAICKSVSHFTVRILAMSLFLLSVATLDISRDELALGLTTAFAEEEAELGDTLLDVESKNENAADPAAGTAETVAKEPKPVPERIPEPPAEIRIATWSGAYAEAQKKAVFTPFTQESGIAINVVPHTGGAALLRDEAPSTGNWDIADVPLHIAEKACEQGKIKKINTTDLRDAAGNPVDLSDFLDQAITPCAVGTNVWSSVVAFDNRQFDGRRPSRLEDFFDIVAFPGKRALPMRPRYVLEMALMADGVPPADVYKTLETDEGVTRALEKLDGIRDNLIWWQSVREPAELLMNGKVVMAVGFNGRFYMATAARDTAIELLWDGQIYDMDVLVIPEKTQHMQTAMKFLSFAVRPEVMAAQASWLPYGPARRSAARLVERHASLPVILTNYLPTAPANFHRALRSDEAWWDKHHTRLIEKFRAWLDGETDDVAKSDSETSNNE